MEGFNHKELNDAEVKEHYQNKISHSSAALENLHNNLDINRP
jgi:hypothetical protein